MGLFGGTSVYKPDYDAIKRDASELTQATPAEQAMLRKLGVSADQADQGMLDQIRKLGERGDDLTNVDQSYMDNAYKPAYDRLMLNYGKMDQDIMENMNQRGIASVPGGESEPENYQRRLLARDTKESLGRTMLDAQNQAVQQKLAQYNARLAEPNLAAGRYEQTMTPLRNATVVNENERQGNKANIYSARLGLAANEQNIVNSQKQQHNQNQMNLIGGGMGVAGSLAMLSDPAMKKDIHEGPDPEQDLQEMSDTPVDRWKYRFEGDETPEHEGAMMDEAPADTQVPGGIDIPSYLGKLTNSVKALNHKMGAFERLMSTQGATA